MSRGRCVSASSSSSPRSCSPSAVLRRLRWMSSLVARASRSRSSMSCSAPRTGSSGHVWRGSRCGSPRASPRPRARRSRREPEARLRAGGLAFLRFAADNRVAYELLYEGRFSEPPQNVRRRQAELILELMREIASDDVDPRELEVAANAVNSAYEGVAHWMWDHPEMRRRAAGGLDRRAAPARTTEVHVTDHHSSPSSAPGSRGSAWRSG